MKYVIYLRVSTDGQDYETQKLRCLYELKKILNSEHFEYEVFSDKRTGRQTAKKKKTENSESDMLQELLKKRPGLIQALDALDKGDVFVSQKIDRIARDGLCAYIVKDALERKKAKLLIIDQPGIDDPVIFSVFVGVAVKESEMISQRTKDKLWAKSQRSERVGTIPYGFKLDPNKQIPVNGPDNTKVLKLGVLIPDEYEQNGIKKMCEYFDKGIRLQKIPMLLAQDGYRNRKGNLFDYTGIRRLLARTGRTRRKDPSQLDEAFRKFHQEV